METSLIEKFDKSRYDLVKWFTMGWIAWYGTIVSKGLIHNNFIIGLLLGIGFFGWIFFMVSLVKLVRLGRRIKSDSRLNEALSNEMHQFYVLKSIAWGFSTVMATACTFIVVSLFYPIPTLVACEFILFVGVSSSLIANLVYNKE